MLLELKKYPGSAPVAVSEDDFTDGANNRVIRFPEMTGSSQRPVIIGSVKADGKQFPLNRTIRLYPGMSPEFPIGSLHK